MIKSVAAIRKAGVVGAGDMGSGLAQKIAVEGFEVDLVDLDSEKVASSLLTIQKDLQEGVEKGKLGARQVEEILGRITVTSDWDRLADVDIVVESVAEDFVVKKEVCAKLETLCRPDTFIGTITSSFSVTDLAGDARYPDRIFGLHYFFSAAKNRLVEIIRTEKTSPAVLACAWAFQERIGKMPIASSDAPGFVVNRYFVPWLNEAVRLLEEGIADIATIDAATRQQFGAQMGPFGFMNVMGLSTTMHMSNMLQEGFGGLYAPAKTLIDQTESGQDWRLDGEADGTNFDAVNSRLMGTVFHVATQLVSEGVGCMEDADIGARVGLRWRRGPFELMNLIGVRRALELAQNIANQWQLRTPRILLQQAGSDQPFRLQLVYSVVHDRVATITLNRPDALNALNEEVVAQLEAAFRAAEQDENVTGIVIAGRGKGFIAGADIRFFVKNIETKDLERILRFTLRGQELLNAIEQCSKPVVARVHGLALGAGLEIALACDYIVAAEQAVMAFPETGIGIYPGNGGTQRTSRRVSVGLAKFLVLTGEVLRATEAAEIGLVDKVAATGQLDQAVLEMLAQGAIKERTHKPTPVKYQATERFFGRMSADALLAGDFDRSDDPVLSKAVAKLGSKAPIALRLADELIEKGAGLSLEEGLKLETDHLIEVFSTRDAYEGLTSVGQRTPSFEGR
jgi:enoyl-CoA hydratase/3-hydroxyacyl-CoA dehydrogenase